MPKCSASNPWYALSSPEVLGCELPMSNSDETLFSMGKTHTLPITLLMEHHVCRSNLLEKRRVFFARKFFTLCTWKMDHDDLQVTGVRSCYLPYVTCPILSWSHLTSIHSLWMDVFLLRKPLGARWEHPEVVGRREDGMNFRDLASRMIMWPNLGEMLFPKDVDAVYLDIQQFHNFTFFCSGGIHRISLKNIL